MEPPWEGGKKVYINGPGHMTKMAATPIYGKIFQKYFFYRTNSPMIMKLRMEHLELNLYTVYINNDPELTLTYFAAMSNLAKLVFVLIVGPDIRCKTIGPLVMPPTLKVGGGAYWFRLVRMYVRTYVCMYVCMYVFMFEISS